MTDDRATPEAQRLVQQWAGFFPVAAFDRVAHRMEGDIATVLAARDAEIAHLLDALDQIERETIDVDMQAIARAAIASARRQA